LIGKSSLSKPTGGGGYKKLHNFFSKIDIQHHVSGPHAHLQNGSAERKHWHIIEVGLALLAYSFIPLKFWDDAFIAAVYLINRTPINVINYKTPLELLFQQKLDYTSLRIFGCACWPNLRPYKNHKLQFRSKRCVFLGYSIHHKGFKSVLIQDGSAKRKHRHIIEVGLALLAYSFIPLKFWDDAFVAVVYLINRTPSKVIDYKTPLEQLFQQKPDYTSLRIFGCACWPNLRPYKNHKLQFHSKRCVFLGYSIHHKGFRPCLYLSRRHL
jgi:hypothetical protein